MTDYALERSVHLAASPSTVFTALSDSPYFASWWGAGSTIDPTPGGAVHIAFPGGVEVVGEVEEIVPERQLVFTYGYAGGNGPIEPGGSLVTVLLEPLPGGTRLYLKHRFTDESVRDQHVPGWRYQLGRLANVVADLQHTENDALFDRFFEAQMVADEKERATALRDVITDDFVFTDRMACLSGPEEFAAHLEAARRHGAAPVIEREGTVRHCQGTAVCDWIAKNPDGSIFLRGSNVADIAPDGRLRRVVGLWDQPPS